MAKKKVSALAQMKYEPSAKLAEVIGSKEVNRFEATKKV